MKTLANCTPREFLAQTSKIRKRAADWLGKTRILEIREKQPVYADGMTDEEKQEAMRRQVKANLNEMLDSMLDEYPNETADLLGLLCFIEPEDLENHKMTEILKAVTDVISDQDVLDFFISLMRLGQTNISPIAKA
jgi:hypothetical protein